MDQIIKYLKAWQELPCVTGKEFPLTKEFLSHFNELSCAKYDEFGNLIFWIHSQNPNAKTILIEAHRDEIGVCVQKIHPGGFVSIVPCGGIDPKILPGTRFRLYGKEKMIAVATSTPPHLSKNGSSKEKADFGDVFLDTGIQTGLESILNVGDVGHFDSPVHVLCNERISTRGLDDKAGVLSMQLAIQQLSETKNNVCFLFSAGEESGHNGVISACKSISPDLAISVDVGFAKAEGLDPTKCIEMGKGPSISYSDTLSIPFTRRIHDLAMQNNVPLQIIAEPGYPGTNATQIQTENGGIPSVLISIPLANMHCPQEIVSSNDIRMTADLLVFLANCESLFDFEVHNDNE